MPLRTGESLDKGTPQGYEVSNMEHDLQENTIDKRSKIIYDQRRIECEDQKE